MNSKECSITDCSKGGQLRRGMCQMHYRRFMVHGDPNITMKPHTAATPEERWKENTTWQGDCLIWSGRIDTYGYGVVYLGKGKVVGAHRYAWEREHGEIPEGMVVDHKDHCDTRCVNVNHLRLATHQQNLWNRSGPQSDNTSGHRNVFWEQRTQKWRVNIWKDGVRHDFGRFTNLEDAARVAENARKELYGEFAGKG